MDTLIKADIFFFITTIAVVAVSTLLIIVFFYIILAFRRLKALCEKVEENMETANVQVKEITTQIKESFIFNLFFGKKSKKKHL